MAGESAEDVIASLAMGREVREPVLIVVAHPDDETIGLGGNLRRLSRLSLLHVTDGAPQDGRDARAAGFADGAAYAAARRRELELALRVGNVSPVCIASLDVPDQGVSRRMADVTRELLARIRHWAPRIVLTHAYEGGHPDHDATAFAVHAARDLLHASGEAAPEVVEMAGYHMGAGGIEAGRFLPGPTRPMSVPLDAAARARKWRMMEAFTTQRETLKYFPVRDSEPLRRSPRTDFTAPPHEGRLFYEGFDWGMTGREFRDRAAAARCDLRLRVRAWV
ncbi:PIG-L deacetylase family protein [Roseomonas sp. CCTCC AB2023176]|uniref:PIG-L deacetylase family protein n=1 Tax=Roseomonas sp. CCTCC AB2023176 TaxID=3342640 RepID=UPI0035DB12CF